MVDPQVEVNWRDRAVGPRTQLPHVEGRQHYELSRALRGVSVV